MAGTIEGGKKTAEKIMQRNPHHYRDIGHIGGQNGNTGGFAYTMTEPCDCGALEPHKNKAGCAGAIGGSISRRKAVPAK